MTGLEKDRLHALLFLNGMVDVDPSSDLENTLNELWDHLPSTSQALDLVLAGIQTARELDHEQVLALLFVLGLDRDAELVASFAEEGHEVRSLLSKFPVPKELLKHLAEHQVKRISDPTPLRIAVDDVGIALCRSNASLHRAAEVLANWRVHNDMEDLFAGLQSLALPMLSGWQGGHAAVDPTEDLGPELLVLIGWSKSELSREEQLATLLQCLEVETAQELEDTLEEMQPIKALDMLNELVEACDDMSLSLPKARSIGLLLGLGVTRKCALDDVLVRTHLGQHRGGASFVSLYVCERAVQALDACSKSSISRENIDRRGRIITDDHEAVLGSASLSAEKLAMFSAKFHEKKASLFELLEMIDMPAFRPLVDLLGSSDLDKATMLTEQACPGYVPVTALVTVCWPDPGEGEPAQSSLLSTPAETPGGVFEDLKHPDGKVLVLLSWKPSDLGRGVEWNEDEAMDRVLELFHLGETPELSQENLETLLLCMQVPIEQAAALVRPLFTGDRQLLGPAEVRAFLQSQSLWVHLHLVPARYVAFCEAFENLDLRRCGKVLAREIRSALKGILLDTTWEPKKSEVTLVEFIVELSSPEVKALITLESLRAISEHEVDSQEHEAEELHELVASLHCLERIFIRLAGRCLKAREDHSKTWRPQAKSQSTSRSLEAARENALLQKEHSHSLSHCERALVFLVGWAVAIFGAGAGALAGYLSNLWQGLARKQVPRNETAEITLTTAYSFVTSIVEILVLYFFGLVAAGILARIFHLSFLPLNLERALIGGALVKSATDWGYTPGPQMGVRPDRKASPAMLLLLSAWAAMQRSTIKLIIKVIVRRVPARVLIHVLDIDGFVEYGVNALFDFVMMRNLMKDVTLCCLGPSAAEVVIVKLLEDRHRRVEEKEGCHVPFSDEVKLNMLRAIGVGVTSKMTNTIHPNIHFILHFLTKIYVTENFVRRNRSARESKDVTGWVKRALAVKDHSVQNLKRLVTSPMTSSKVRILSLVQRTHERLEPLCLDDEDALLEALSGFREEDADLILCLIAFTSFMDGRVATGSWILLETACGWCAPPRLPSIGALAQVRYKYHCAQLAEPEDFLKVINGTGPSGVSPFYEEWYMLRILALQRACCRRRSQTGPTLQQRAEDSSSPQGSAF